MRVAMPVYEFHYQKFDLSVFILFRRIDRIEKLFINKVFMYKMLFQEAEHNFGIICASVCSSFLGVKNPNGTSIGIGT